MSKIGKWKTVETAGSKQAAGSRSTFAPITPVRAHNDAARFRGLSIASRYPAGGAHSGGSPSALLISFPYGPWPLD